MYPAMIIAMVDRKSNPSIMTLGTGGVNVVCSFGEWEETPEVVAAVAKLQETIKQTKHDLAELELKRPHERQTSNS